MPVTQEEFVRAYPTLFHVSLANNVDQISRHGLLSTSALLDFCEVGGSERFSIESQRRPKAVPIRHPVHGSFVINDQAPMSGVAWRGCLIALSPQGGYDPLTRRVFFGPSRSRLEKHLAARLA